MYQDFNEQFAAASRQFADTAAQVNRLALENAEKVFGLQLATFEENANATFAFWGEVAEARDFDGLKAAWPKGVRNGHHLQNRSDSDCSLIAVSAGDDEADWGEYPDIDLRFAPEGYLHKDGTPY